jgi:hypothetical protein
MLSYKLLKNIKLKKKYSVFLKSILNRYVKKIHFKADEFYSKTRIKFLKKCNKSFRVLVIKDSKKI